MLKELDSSKLMEVNGGKGLIYYPFYWLGKYVRAERSPEEQARIREMNRQHYGY